tara:strand:+ start:37 stop:702 length:666 start_codon:yes stop_codon:yes gene_type:complete
MYKNIAMIPARLGSQRLLKKNLLLFGDKTLIEHAICRCKEAEIFDEIYVNSESIIFKDFADKHGVQFYHRPDNLGDNNATSEEFVEDFLRNIECVSLFQIHSITPLLDHIEIKKFTQFCNENSDLDTVLTCIEDQIEIAFENKPVNFSLTRKSNSQELTPVQRVTWSATKWNSKAYLEAKQKNKIGTYSGRVGFYPVSSFSGLAIKTEEDLAVANKLNEVL